MGVIDRIIQAELEWSNEEIRKQLAAKNINDTGNASRSLEVKKFDNENYQTLGVDYLEFVNTGRGAGGIPARSRNIIQNWVRRKLGITDPKALDTATYFIRKKISESGTRIFRDKSEGIELDKIVDELNERLGSELLKGYSIEVEQQLNDFFNKRFGNANIN